MYWNDFGACESTERYWWFLVNWKACYGLTNYKSQNTLSFMHESKFCDYIWSDFSMNSQAKSHIMKGLLLLLPLLLFTLMAVSYLRALTPQEIGMSCLQVWIECHQHLLQNPHFVLPVQYIHREVCWHLPVAAEHLVSAIMLSQTLRKWLQQHTCLLNLTTCWYEHQMILFLKWQEYF